MTIHPTVGCGNCLTIQNFYQYTFKNQLYSDTGVQAWPQAILGLTVKRGEYWYNTLINKAQFWARRKILYEVKYVI